MKIYNFIDIDTTTVLLTQEMDSTTFNPIEVTSHAINEQTTAEGIDYDFSNTIIPKEKEYGSTNDWFTTSTADYTSDFDSYATTTESERSGGFDGFTTMHSDYTSDFDSSATTTETDYPGGFDGFTTIAEGSTTLEDFSTSSEGLFTTSTKISTDETQETTTYSRDTSTSTNSDDDSTIITSFVEELINVNDSSAADRDTIEANWNFTAEGSDGFFTTDNLTDIDNSIQTTKNAMEYTTVKSMVSTLVSDLIERYSSETTTKNEVESSTSEIEINSINDDHPLAESNKETTIGTTELIEDENPFADINKFTNDFDNLVSSPNEEKESSTVYSMISTIVDKLINEFDTSAANDDRIITSHFDSSEETTEMPLKTTFSPSNTEVENDTLIPFLESVATTIKSLVFNDFVVHTTDIDDTNSNTNNPNTLHEASTFASNLNQPITELDENMLDIETIKPTMEPVHTLNQAALEEIVDDISENETTPSTTLEFLTTTVKSILDKAASYIVDRNDDLAVEKAKEVTTIKTDIENVIENAGNGKKVMTKTKRAWEIIHLNEFKKACF